MRRLLEFATALIPLLDRYPRWVSLVAVLWLIASVVFVITLILAPRKPSTPSEEARSQLSSAVVASPHSTVYQAGRDVIINSSNEKSEADFFHVRYHTSLVIQYPGPLVYRYDSSLGQKLAPVGYAVVMELTNKTGRPVRLHDYTLDAALEGKWVRLENLQPLNLADLFWVRDGDLRDSVRLDFTETSFDSAARASSVPPGESLRGWMFFEWPAELRNVKPLRIEKLRLKIETSDGRSQEFVIETGAIQEPGSALLSGGQWRVLPGRVDLGDLEVLPHGDLLRQFKEEQRK